MAASSIAAPVHDDPRAGALGWYAPRPSPTAAARSPARPVASASRPTTTRSCSFGLVAVIAHFGISKGQAGLLATVTLVVSAVGGIGSGLLIGRIGRSRTLMITVRSYALFTVLSGFGWNYPALLTFRALQGLGFGGERAAGAILVAEYASAKYRGRTVAVIQSSWAASWALAVIVTTNVLDHVHPGLAWRIIFWTGALPGLLLLYLRRNVKDAPRTRPLVEKKKKKKKKRIPLVGIFTDGLTRTTIFAALMATGVQGGYYTIATWLPDYLKTVRGLTICRHRLVPVLAIGGAFIGYLCGGYLSGSLGRRTAIALFGVLSAVTLFTYIHIPAHENPVLLILGSRSGSASPPSSAASASAWRSSSRGWCAAPARASATKPAAPWAFFPTAVGFAAGGKGLGGALIYGVIGYIIAVLALLGLPETRGADLA